MVRNKGGEAMSSSISGTTIKMTRGDTLNVQVSILKDSEPYAPQVGDSVRFALKRNKIKSDRSGYADDDPLILKDIPTDTLILTLDPEDTKQLPFDTYVYDIEITFADGAVDTFIDKATFKLTEEVH